MPSFIGLIRLRLADHPTSISKMAQSFPFHSSAKHREIHPPIPPRMDPDGCIPSPPPLLAHSPSSHEYFPSELSSCISTCCNVGKSAVSLSFQLIAEECCPETTGTGRGSSSSSRFLTQRCQTSSSAPRPRQMNQI